ncbi:MAG: beta-N-acetylhexosaminidase [Candidatus Omnitrophica bacterium]|nr:beta-N-acetylhexosaminidase [Candidatus Omnitrophota bacterium]
MLERLIGSCLVVGFQGTDATDALIASLRALEAQNLIVFERNFRSPEQFIRLIRRLEEALGSRLLVMIDHEGGRVIRFSAGVTRFPDARAVSATQGVEAVARQGAVEAEELKRLGVRMNLAPCVDVIVEGADPVIGDRSYGADPARVSELACARIRGLQRGSVAACAKHFPGLGAVPRDPHQTLPTIPCGWEAMERVHLKPFQAAIESGVAAVMSSHVCYPGLGDPPNHPATFSPALIRELLRKRLGFSGLILTDDLEMGALRARGTVAEASVRAKQAGHDLLLICSDLSAATAASKALMKAFKHNELNRAELEESVERLSRVRQTFLSRWCPNLVGGAAAGPAKLGPLSQCP